VKDTRTSGAPEQSNDLHRTGWISSVGSDHRARTAWTVQMMAMWYPPGSARKSFLKVLATSRWKGSETLDSPRMNESFRSAVEGSPGKPAPWWSQVPGPGIQEPLVCFESVAGMDRLPETAIPRRASPEAQDSSRQMLIAIIAW